MIVTEESGSAEAPQECSHPKLMLHLPLPHPWTIETVSEYVDELIKFVNEYEDIASFNSKEVFSSGLPLDWVPDHDLETWIAIVSGDYTGNWSGRFSRFVQRSRQLPLLDNNKPLHKRSEKRQGFTPKKEHEVDAMMAFVAEMMSVHKVTSRNVLDVGSGLGYLSAELSKAGFHVVGVEGDPERATKAIPHTQVESVCKMVTNYKDLDIVKDCCVSLSLRIFQA